MGKKISNEQLLAMCDEAQAACDQLNSMSYNKPQERALIDSHIDRLDLIHKELSGDFLVTRVRKNLGKIVLQ